MRKPKIEEYKIDYTAHLPKEYHVTIALNKAVMNKELGNSIVSLSQEKAEISKFIVSEEEVRRKYRQIVKESNNLVTWGMKLSHRDYTRGNKNVLFIENGLLRQNSGVFMDAGGYFADSNFKKFMHYARSYTEEELAGLEEHVNRRIGPFLGGGNPDGPVLVTLQKENDAPMQHYFPAIRGKSGNRIALTWNLLMQNLPKGRQYVIKPHPRHIEDWNKVKDYLKTDRDDIIIDSESNFYDLLKECSALVTVNSTTAIEALSVGVPVAVLGEHVWTGSRGVFLDCSRMPKRLGSLFSWKADEEKVKRFLCAVKRQHVPYNTSIENLREHPEFRKWISRLKKANGKVTEQVQVQTKLPPSRQILANFFNPEKENPIPDSDHLRKKYFEELERMGGSSCSGCQLNGLRSKYMNKLISRKLL